MKKLCGNELIRSIIGDPVESRDSEEVAVEKPTLKKIIVKSRIKFVISLVGDH